MWPKEEQVDFLLHQSFLTLYKDVQRTRGPGRKEVHVRSFSLPFCLLFFISTLIFSLVSWLRMNSSDLQLGTCFCPQQWCGSMAINHLCVCFIAMILVFINIWRRIYAVSCKISWKTKVVAFSNAFPSRALDWCVGSWELKNSPHSTLTQWPCSGGIIKKLNQEINWQLITWGNMMFKEKGKTFFGLSQEPHMLKSLYRSVLGTHLKLYNFFGWKINSIL